MNFRRWIAAGLLAVGLLEAGAAETLLVNYFDIPVASPAGTEVYGRIHLDSNRDAHHRRIPETYHFEILSDPSGLFELDAQRDSESRLFGALRIASGHELPKTPTNFVLQVALRDGSTLLASTNLTVCAVAQTTLQRALTYLDRLTQDESRFYGRRRYTDAQVAALITEVEQRQGGFASLGFYTRDLLSYRQSGGQLGREWEEASNIIGGMGYAYRMSKQYGPGGDPAAHQRLKRALYLAISRYAELVPMAGEDVVIDGKPLSSNYGDGFNLLAGSLGMVEYNYISHPWRFHDALSGPAVWLMPELLKDARAGDPLAIRTHEKLIRIFQLTFSNPPSYQASDNEDGRWGDLTDPHHTEGAYSDANLGHRLRSWMTLLGIWADYNRPITYIPNWYPGFYTGPTGENLQFMPGWTPHGVLPDLTFWVTHFHRPAHYFVQSGFQPDGTVSHHLPKSSDIAMHAYGYGWLTEVVSGYLLLKDEPVDLGSHGYQFIADRLLYSYDKMIYNGAMDFTVCGRSYSGSMKKFVDGVARDVTRMMEAKQAGTVITNEAALLAWRDTLLNRTQVCSGNFPFWVGQFMVHRRGGNGEAPCYYSVKMENDRTSGAEDFEKVGKSYHSGSGLLQAKVRGDEYEETRYNWDWHALPGLTEEWRNDPIPVKPGIAFGGSPFAAMASDGRYGFAAMEYRAQPKQYAAARADKAFFFTASEAVALGNSVARVNPGQGREIVTTIDQTLWVGDVTYAIDDGAPQTIKAGETVDLALHPTQPSWIHQGRVGYVVIPQGNQPLYIRGGKAVQVADPKEATGKEVIHFALGHGRDPAQAGLTRYVYLVAANKTAKDMPAYMEEVLSRVTVVTNGAGLQAVADASLGLVQAAFYKAGEVTLPDGLTVSVDRPALLQLRRDGANWQVCATNPRHDPAQQELNFKLNRPLAPGVYPYSLGGIYPQPGETVSVERSGDGVKVNVQLPDLRDDARYHYQAPLYAGMPVRVALPAGER